MVNHISLTLEIPHTRPIMPVISVFQHAVQSIPDDERAKERAEKMFHLNNSIFLKAEFAKTAFRIIEDCYEKYGKEVEGGYLVRPDLFFPAWRELDNLIFELGSILDFFSREINLAFDLNIPLQSVGFFKVVKTCEKKIPDERITKTLTEFHNSELHKYFRKMRNRITHKLPIVLRGMNDQIYFPDNPNDDNIFPKTDLMIDIYQTCRDWLHEILEFVDTSSVLVFEMIAKMVINDEDGHEITIEELITRQRRELEDRLG